MTDETNSAKLKELALKKDLYNKIIEKIGNSEIIKGVVLFSNTMKSNQRNGLDAQIMIVCERLCGEEDFLYLQDTVSKALSPMSVELVFFDEIVDQVIRKDIIESGIHCSVDI